jgi:hypothetical protein
MGIGGQERKGLAWMFGPETMRLVVPPSPHAQCNYREWGGGHAVIGALWAQVVAAPVVVEGGVRALALPAAGSCSSRGGTTTATLLSSSLRVDENVVVSSLHPPA